MMRPVHRLWIGRRLILMAGDAVILYTVASVLFSLRDPNWRQAGLATPILPILFFTGVTAYAAGLYELRLIRNFVVMIGGLLGSSVASWIFCMTYFYFLPRLGVAPKATLLLIVAGSHVGMLVWRRAVLSATGFNLCDMKILIIGDQDCRDYVRQAGGRQSSGEFHFVEGADCDLIVVDQGWAKRRPEEARRMLAGAIAGRIPIVSIDEFEESAYGKVSTRHAKDLAWALDHLLPRLGSPYFKIKRVLDVVTAAVFLLILAVPLLVVAVAIGIADRTTPLYAQTRVGYQGRRFVLWKFRTMRPGAERQGPFMPCSRGRDLRVTPLGRALRRLRIDELPQLWNVLKGDMSLVGPRPEWIKEVEILEPLIPTYTLRYLVPPGITGWAQVYFIATNSPEASVEKHSYDLYYLKHFSLALDFSIMLKTVKRAFVKDSRLPAYHPPRPGDPASVSETAALDIGSIVGRG